MVIVVNKGNGQFKLSYKAIKRYAELKGTKIVIDWGMPIIHLGNGEFFEDDSTVEGEDSEAYPQYLYYYPELESFDKWTEREISRDDPALVQTVKELGKEANVNEVLLEIIQIPDNTPWQVECIGYGDSVRIGLFEIIL